MPYPYYNPVYQPNYNYNPYYQQAAPAPVQQTQQTVQQQSQQPMQSGFVLVRSEQEAMSYPVAPGNSITFKDENKPYCYVKTMSYNTLDRPTFERYKLVKEEAPTMPQNEPVASESSKAAEYATRDDVDKLRAEIDKLKSRAKTKEAKHETDDDE